MPKFQVLRGAHSEGKRADGRAYIYGPGQPDGDVVDSASDLGKYNLPGVPPRYRLLEEAEPKPRIKPKEKAEAASS